jgi:hypothetical protein
MLDLSRILIPAMVLVFAFGLGAYIVLRFTKKQLTALWNKSVDWDNSPLRLNKESYICFGNRLSSSVQISLTKLKTLDALEPINLPPAAKSHVSDLLLEAAELYGIGSGIRRFELHFSAEVTRQLRNGQLELMKSSLGTKAIAIDPKDHRILEIGSIGSNINPLAAVAFAWEIMAFITAQKFLADINQRLAFLATEVSELRHFLYDENESEIFSNYDYLRQVTSAIASGNLAFEDIIVIGTQLEDIERQSSRSVHLALRGAKRRLDELRDRHDKNWGNLDEFVGYARDESTKFSQWGRLNLLALATRTVATYLRVVLPLNKDIARNRLLHLQDDLGQYRQLQQDFRIKLTNTTESMDSLFRFSETIEASKATAKKHIEDVDSALSNKLNEMAGVIVEVDRVVRTQEQEQASPFRCVAELGKNNALTIARLPLKEA